MRFSAPLLEQGDRDFGQVDDLHGDRTQQHALNATETTRSHHNVVNARLTRDLCNRLRELAPF